MTFLINIYQKKYEDLYERVRTLKILSATIFLAGLPTHISLSGMELKTTLLAATTEFSPIVTPYEIIEQAPINAFFLILIGAVSADFISSFVPLIFGSNE